MTAPDRRDTPPPDRHLGDSPLLAEVADLAVRWESLVGRIVVILILGAFFVWVGSGLWNPSPLPARIEPCSRIPHSLCAVSGGDPIPHLAIVAGFGLIWAITAFVLIRNWFKPTSDRPPQNYI